MLQVVGISDLKTSTDPKDVIITYSLGSCVGVSLYDPVLRVGGMLHAMLPLSKVDAAKAESNPLMYADLSLTMLLQKVFDLGATKKNLVAKVAGASRFLDKKDLFKIGERNYTVVRKILWKNDILISGEQVGGSVPRTMSLHLDTGRTTIKSKGSEVEI